MSQPSSVLFSLNELARMEEERVSALARAQSAAQEAARRGITTIELIRQIIDTHDGAARTTRRRSAAEPALNT